MRKNSFSFKLVHWYQAYGRNDLPWRKRINPYKVWISEIMLQQTQVATVISYYQQFMKTFPSVTKLANAHIDEVLHCWSGLGYYSRARNLHKTAQIIVTKYKCNFPNDLAELQTLAGIGRSTAAAILAISYNEAHAILDGNVKRVLTRVFNIDGYPGITKIQNKLWSIADQLVPAEHAHDYTQGIMDLGATVCTRKNPSCNLCPVKSFCEAYKLNKQNQLPTPKSKKSIPEKSIFMLVLKNTKGEILLEKRPPSGIWGGLWSLPECENQEHIKSFCSKDLGYTIKQQKNLSAFRHTFSHYHLHITPILLTVSTKTGNIKENALHYWQSLSKPITKGLPAPIKQILKEAKHESKSSLSKVKY